MDFIKIRFGDDRGVADTETQGTAAEGILRLFDPTYVLQRRVWKPPVNIYETAERITIVAELAGVSDEDIHLEVSRRTVKIAGKRMERFRVKNSRYRLAEITYGHFERTLSLSVPIDTDGVSATYNDGMLEIHIPKLPPERKVRRIIVQSE
ncbi:MAG: Hsp20/alpha crystallin family protein [Deltaproteobacteria bacterium]|nr:Hsp20/alpha crystallin family protein [Deltaproteobacteria bacterium]MBW2674275.1 Hsp20/alpha crystallin family protein [Deltaproteobacteria bacterium]